MNSYKRQVFLFLLLMMIVNKINSQQSLLESGPMTTYSEMRESAVWVQLKGPGKVQMAYWSKENKQDIRLSQVVESDPAYGHIALLVADQVEPGTKYSYTIFINNQPCVFEYPTTFQTQYLWQWREDPPAFKFATGSCFYINEEATDRPGRPFGGSYPILKQIVSTKPDFMLWLGDNVYLRDPDWGSKTGFIRRYTHTRSEPSLQPLLGGTHHYAIWDDHDYGPNDSDRTWRMKQVSLDVFNKFWPSSATGITGAGGITQHFQWSDCDFFLLDDRWFKSPNETPGEVLGSAQVKWLKYMLLQSEAPFKFVGLGVMFLSTAANKENMSKAGIPEREEIIQFIQEHKIEGVVFLTGDRHFSELSMLSQEGKPTIFDLTSSPITAGKAASKYIDEVNDLRVPNTAYFDRNFATLEVSGTQKERKLEMKLHDVDGKVLWTKSISTSNYKLK
jgi:alkaline phosphatase D